MADFTFSTNLSGLSLQEYYQLPLDRLSGSTPKHVEYQDESSSYQLIMDGRKFVYGGQFDGEVEKMSFRTDEGKALLSISGADYDGSEMVQAFIDGDFEGMMNYLLAGNDTLKGSTAADEIYGGAGKDTISGGKGADDISGGRGADRLSGGDGMDEFHFDAGDGKDTIVDFDAKGGGSKQDYLYISPEMDFDVTYNKKGAIVDFDNGDTVTLLGLKKGDFTTADVHYWDA